MSEEKLASAQYSDRICLNYTEFLSASCKKRWSFVDAIYGVIPFFGMITRKPSSEPQASEAPLKDLALQIISTQVSDEINIARLITLAHQQQIEAFDIQLPYPLSETQLIAIRQEYARPVDLEQRDERLSVMLPLLAH